MYVIHHSFVSSKVKVTEKSHVLFQEVRLVNNDLTAKEIVTLLAHDDPKVTDPEGAVMVEFEMTFLEFFEALVGCAQVYVTEAVVKDPSTPPPSTAAGMTREHSLMSVPASQSRMQSQTGGNHKSFFTM